MVEATAVRNIEVEGLVEGLRSKLVSEVTPIGLMSDFLLDVRCAAGGNSNLIQVVDGLHHEMMPAGARRSVVLTTEAKTILERVAAAAN